ncbi:hypothetical protein MIR68_002232 [Amoeboaphelidium protococcarum]|nr:hypothetical protein MIR68_002232 [Amoeboaphelidium protococcarum]
MQLSCGNMNGISCDTGFCCSSRGYCGITAGHCGRGCQSIFGSCWPDQNASQDPLPQPELSSLQQEQPVEQLQPKRFFLRRIFSKTEKADARVGRQVTCGHMNGQSCGQGDCCSSNGICGKTLGHCGTGCQSAFGLCWSPNEVKRKTEKIKNGGVRIPYYDIWKEPNLVKTAMNAKFGDTIHFSSPEDDIHVPQTYKPRTMIPMLPYVAPCQLVCNRVKNKAYHGLATSDIGLVAQAYLNAVNGLPPVGKETLIHGANLVVLTAVITAIQCMGIIALGAFNAFAPVIAAPHLLMVAQISGPNSVDYLRIIHACEIYLKKRVGKKALQDLAEIGRYRNHGGVPFQMWLMRQRVQIEMKTDSSGQQCVEYQSDTVQEYGQIMDDLLPQQFQEQ